MNKDLLKNKWILAGLLLVIGIIVSLIIWLIIKFIFHSDSTIASAIGGIIGANIVGMIYYSNFKEIMPKTLRRNVTLIYMSLQVLILILVILVYYLFLGLGLNYIVFLIILSILILFVYGFIIYHGSKYPYKIK